MSELVRAALATIVEGGTLSMDDARGAMGAVMDGEATPAQLAALLMGLRMRGETVDELAGFAAAMRERVVRVEAPDGAIDVVGTGGDGSGTFNISTTRRPRRGGRPACPSPSTATGRSPRGPVRPTSSTRSASGSTTTRPPPAAALREHGFAFMFAPGFHPAMRHAGPTRREIGVRTAFNLLGPLTNPAGHAPAGRSGVGDAGRGRADRRGRAGCWARSGRSSIHGDGVDELPLDGSGVLYDVTPEGIERRTVDAGRARASPRPDLARWPAARPRRTPGWSRRSCAASPGARRDVVLLNAGAALLVAGAVETLEEGIERAALTIDAGLGTELLERLRAERRAAEAPLRRPRPRRADRPARRRDRRRRGQPAPRHAAPAATVRRPAPAERRRRRSPPGAGPTSLAELAGASRGSHPRRRPGRRPARARSPNASRAPGLHLIAELKRASPSAGRIAAAATTSSPAPGPTRPAARRRSPSCASPTGSAARSTTCARSARPSRSRSWPRSSSSTRASSRCCVPRAPTSCCCSPSSIRRGASARLVDAGPRARAGAARRGPRRARARAGARHAEPASSGSTTATCERLEVDLERAARLRELVPDDRLVIAESGVREPATIARWRALGFDGALVGEALMRAAEPGRGGRARSSRPAARPTTRPTSPAARS